MRPSVTQWLPKVLGLVLAVSLGGCITSSKPLFGSRSRALPVPVGTKFDVYNRDAPDKPWTKENEIQTLVADRDGLVRLAKSDSDKSEPFSVHRIATDLYLAQSRVEDKTGKRSLYVYAVVSLHDGEAIMTMLECEKLDLAMFKALGGTTSERDSECNVDRVADRIGVIKGIALRNPHGPQVRYVVRKE